ncbi:MAG TPA: ferric reductase-like transmembrane domain-containing protein, partial [Gaiellales bacterium]|nr:ferric reductase-like transmembrane domain-containing protein [Gaiellales bacterium]
MAPSTTHDRDRRGAEHAHRRDDAPRPRRGYRWVPTLHHRARHAPNPRHTDVVSWLIGLGMGMTLALGVRAESWGDLTKPGGIATFGGRLSALAGTYLMLVVVLLISRLPAIERSMGHDKLVRWHRKLAPIALCLIVAHGLLITLGYAQGASRGVLHEFWVILTTLPGMLMATAGFALFMAAGLTSYRIARRRLTHEAWWLVHLTTYLAITLSFFHQVWTGASFVSDPLAKLWWTSVYFLVAAAIVWYRALVPLWRSLYHRLRVVAVYPEGPGTVSIVLEGRHLDRLPVNGGQFFQWRFLRPGIWWQAHPYSLSAAPWRDELRITVKDLGDHSAGLGALRPGTRVAIEGPYGTFTADSAEHDRLLLVGAGVGTAPILALLEELPEETDVTVLLRGSTRADLVLRDEVADEVAHRGGRLLELVGSRAEVRLDARALRALVPDVRHREA